MLRRIRPAEGPFAAWLSPYPVRIIEDPPPRRLRALALLHTPAILKSRRSNLDKISRNKSRVERFTYIVAPDEDRELYSSQTMPRERARATIERQRAYIQARGELIAINGYLGLGPEACPVQWLYSLEAANIAAMQQILAFPRAAVESARRRRRPFVPRMRVVYTPGCPAEGLPGRQAILVDLEHWTTYILGPDYFGESKKAALRMLNEHVYRDGGLVLHAGAKAVRLGRRSLAMTVMGLSGTGKTTTTFSRQGDFTAPIQDDMVCLWPGGRMSVTENGCFAKTFGLTHETEPVIHRGTLDRRAWVENAYLDEHGEYDFSKARLTPAEVARLRDVLVRTGADPANVDAYARGTVAFEGVVDASGVPRDGWDFVVWTQNGRSVVPRSAIRNFADLRRIPPVRSMGILNRDEGPDAATPGIVRFVSPEQAAGYFMLGETTKTSAAGKERGRTRSPFTQPFFPGAAGLQAARFSEILRTMPGVTLWLMNTGYVGGDAADAAAGRALKVKIHHSSAMLEALLAERVVWRRDPDFGYEIVDVEAAGNAALLDQVPAEILQPRRLYERAGRLGEYAAWVEAMRRERRAFLERHRVERAIVEAVGGRA
jgi:phosphoenolpyruvate carboxykinase (ATP)